MDHDEFFDEGRPVFEVEEKKGGKITAAYWYNHYEKEDYTPLTQYELDELNEKASEWIIDQIYWGVW